MYEESLYGCVRKECGMKKKALSIIIPVYNVEAYLEQCVKSILDQWTPEVEVILVDDGSTDNSGKLCDKFAAQSKELIVVHQENGGLSAARNTGLRFATGRYITFVDSDDFIGDNSVQKILSWIEGSSADICFMNAWKLFPNGRKELLDVPIPHEMLCKGKLNAVKYLSEMNKYPGSAWGKLFRRTFLIQNNLDFPRDRRISEDLGFMRDCILKAERFDSLPIDFYYYRQGRSNSITNKITKKSFDGVGKFVTESAEKLTLHKKAIGTLESYVMSFAAYEYSIMIWQYSCLTSEEKKASYLFLKEYQWVLEYGRTRKIRLINQITRFLGIGICSKILNFYMQNRKRSK